MLLAVMPSSAAALTAKVHASSPRKCFILPPPLSSYRFTYILGNPVEMLQAALDGLDIAELRVDVEEIPQHRAGDAVADRLLDRDRPEAVGEAVAHRLAHAGRG